MKKNKIALFSPTLDVKVGYGNITHELSAELQKKGVDFTLFLPRSEQVNIEKYATYRAVAVGPEYLFRVKSRHIFGYLFPTLDLSNYTIVHSLFDFPYCFYAKRLASKNNKPFVMGAQGTYGVLPLTYFPEKYMLKSCYRGAKHVTVPSVYTKEQIEEKTGEEYQIEVIHNGVNFKRFNRVDPPQKLVEKYKGRSILLTVGGLKRRKGQDMVIKALSSIVKERSDVLYLIVGSGGYRAHLEGLVSDFGVEDHVQFVGRVDDEELPAYFALCDIYVHTPRVVNYNFEGFGIVYLEAGAAGKPVVASDDGGIRDAVIDNVTGLVAESENPSDVARKVIHLLNNDDLRERLGNGGKKNAGLHDWSSVAEKFIELYEE